MHRHTGNKDRDQQLFELAFVVLFQSQYEKIVHDMHPYASYEVWLRSCSLALANLTSSLPLLWHGHVSRVGGVVVIIETTISRIQNNY